MSLDRSTRIDESAGFPAPGLAFITFWSSPAFGSGNLGQTATLILGPAEARGEQPSSSFKSAMPGGEADAVVRSRQSRE